MKKPLVLPFDSSDATLENVGGKGANLSFLTHAGFPVPQGFLLTTQAYNVFIQANDLEEWILQIAGEAKSDDLSALEETSQVIRTRFSEGKMPQDLATAILDVHTQLAGSPVAVRSSATAEDLPGMSFAGQQDTYLNIRGEDALLKAVVDCWSSLWTARAMGYRVRNHIPHQGAALAVVVEEMVQSEASGVMFTANPLTGSRREVVIDATLGLGEALVSGQVEPDHYVVQNPEYQITGKTLGAKAVAVRGQAQGGVVTEEIQAANRQAISDSQILELADLGRKVEAAYHFPQDIEWAFANDRLFILQSRPITSLFPLPEGMDPEPVQVMFSFGAVQGMLDPMTPLGQDVIRLIFAGGASLFDFKDTYKTQRVIKIAGERLWGNMTSILRHPIGHRMLFNFFPVIDPGSIPALKALSQEPALEAGKGRLRWHTFRRLARFMIPMLVSFFRHLLAPAGKVAEVNQKMEAVLTRLEDKVRTNAGGSPSLTHSAALVREMRTAFIFAVPEMLPVIMAGMMPIVFLDKIAKYFTGSGTPALEITRGMPDNVTTEMDLALWRAATVIRSDTEACRLLQNGDPATLAQQYLDRQLPETAQKAIQQFLERYGMRGVAEIDIGRIRWREDPTPILQILRSYLQIEDASQAPDAVFQRGAAAAEKAVAELENAARKTFLGGLKARVVRAAALRVRTFAGLRESPKFYIIRMMGMIRQELLQNGESLVREGKLSRPDDLFFLTLEELEAFARGEPRDWVGLVASHRASFDREMLRVQVPRLLLSDGRTFYEGITSLEGQEGEMRGSPVSPGLVEGAVRVVLNPQNANLEPGEILVCPGTDPAWTPLFLAAGGLVMEVGGMMTHGAIVAREYGIPAVVGVDRATTRLHTGQRIRVDGTSGQILLL